MTLKITSIGRRILTFIAIASVTATPVIHAANTEVTFRLKDKDGTLHATFICNDTMQVIEFATALINKILF